MAAMNTYLWASLGAVIGILLRLVYLRRRQALAAAAGDGAAAPARPGPRSATPVQSKSRPPSGFHAVTLRPCLDACEAVQAIAGQRFLSSEAPALPLAGCDQQRCDCTYGHSSDRREKGDRRSGWERLGGLSHALAKGNRRDKEGDRRDDG